MANNNGHPLAYTRANRVGEHVMLTPGVTLKAVDSLTDRDQQHFTRAQVAYLVALAYESGRTHAAAEDMAETVACWREFADAPTTREQRVQQRLDDMAAGVEREARRPKPPTSPTSPLDVDWPEVAQPGGRADLRVVA